MNAAGLPVPRLTLATRSSETDGKKPKRTTPAARAIMVTAKADSETLKRDAARIRELFASLDVDQRAVLIAWAEFYALQNRERRTA